MHWQDSGEDEYIYRGREKEIHSTALSRVSPKYLRYMRESVLLPKAILWIFKNLS